MLFRHKNGWILKLSFLVQYLGMDTPGLTPFTYMALPLYQDISLPSKLWGGYREYLPFLRSKVKRLLVPYVFVMLVWVAPISACFFNWNLSYLAKKYLLAIDPSQLWFLWMLFGVFAIVWPIRRTLLEKPLAGWAIVLFFYE